MQKNGIRNLNVLNNIHCLKLDVKPSKFAKDLRKHIIEKSTLLAAANTQRVI